MKHTRPRFGTHQPSRVSQGAALVPFLKRLLLCWQINRALAERKRLRQAGYARHYRRVGR